MVFDDNFIHADLHPGNVIFQQQHQQQHQQHQQHGANEWQLSFIDAGLVAQLQPEDRKNFIDLFAAVVTNDGVRVGELMVERSRGGGVDCPDREGFARQIGELVHEVHASGLALGKGNTPSRQATNTPSGHISPPFTYIYSHLSHIITPTSHHLYLLLPLPYYINPSPVGIGSLLQKVLVLCYLHKVKLESKFVAVIIAMGVLEGLGRRLDPDIDVLLRAAPYVLRAALSNKQQQTTPQ